MKTNTSFMQLARNMSTVGLLISISKVGVEAVKTTAAVETEAQADASLMTLAESMQQALMEQGLEAGSATELQSMIKNHVHSRLKEACSSNKVKKLTLKKETCLISSKT